MIAPYARRDAALIGVGGIIATVLVAWLAGAWALAPAILALGLLAFYRDPRRRSPTNAQLILAAADGRIVRIDRTTDPDGRPVLRIMTFLSVFNVHINRSACAGRVVGVEHHPGRFLNALNPAADTENECNTLTLEPAPPLPGPIRVRQVAGVLAKRIVCAARVGDTLRSGEKYGMIKLGSRTEIVLPDDGRWAIAVQVGTRVRAGLTIIATYRATP